MTEAATVSDWPTRLLLTAATGLFIAFFLWLMWRSWQRRRRQAPADLPTSYSDTGVRAKFVGVVKGEDLWRREVSFGGPQWGTLQQSADHIVLPTGLVLPCKQLLAVRWAAGMLQRAYHRHGLILLTWRTEPGQTYTTGLWIPDGEVAGQTFAQLSEYLAAGVTT